MLGWSPWRGQRRRDHRYWTFAPQFLSLESRQMLAGTPTAIFSLNSALENAGALEVIHGIAYFGHGDENGDHELWRSDGTATGTWRVKDIYSGLPSSFPDQLTNVGGMLYFTAVTAETGRELWRSDGTEAGTVRVTDIRAGSFSTFVTNVAPELYTGGLVVSNFLTAVQSRLYFLVTPDYGNVELWVTDGTTSGTRRLQGAGANGDQLLGHSQSVSLQNYQFTAAGDRLYFVSRIADNAPASLMWTNGDQDGIRQVTSMKLADALVAVGDQVYFTAVEDGSVRNVYRMDALGIQQVTRWTAGQAAGRMTLSTNGVRVFAATERSVWMLDDSTAGATRLPQFPPNHTAKVSEILPTENKLYVALTDGPLGQIWEHDLESGVQTLVDRFQSGLSDAYINDLQFVDSRLFYRRGFVDLTMVDPRVFGGVDFGKELYISQLFAEKLVNGKYLVAASGPSGNQQLWLSNGATVDSTPFLDWRTGNFADDEFANYYDVDAVPFGNKIVLDHFLGWGPSIYTVSLTTPLLAVSNVTIRPPFSFAAGTEWRGRAYFAGLSADSKWNWWESDGSVEGTRVAIDVASLGIMELGELAVFKDALYFVGKSTTLGWSVWRSDGTTAGTTLILDPPESDRELFPYPFAPIEISVPPAGKGGEPWLKIDVARYFSAADRAIYLSDGTSSNILRLRDLPPGISGVLSEVLGANNQSIVAVVTSDSPVAQASIISIDRATGQVQTLFQRPVGQYTDISSVEPAAFQGRWLFQVDSKELWATDGTPAGTELFAPSVAREAEVSNLRVTSLRDALLLVVAYSGNSNKPAELWRTDGTEAGTWQLPYFQPISDRVTTDYWTYVEVPTVEYGTELWRTDGTANGTQLVYDLFPGVHSSHICHLQSTDDALYFMARDPLHAHAWWQYALDAPRRAGDTDADGDVDSLDMLWLIENWTGAGVRTGRTVTRDHGDTDGDGDVDSLDLLNAVTDWTGAAALPPDSLHDIAAQSLPARLGRHTPQVQLATDERDQHTATPVSVTDPCQ